MFIYLKDRVTEIEGEIEEEREMIHPPVYSPSGHKHRTVSGHNQELGALMESPWWVEGPVCCIYISHPLLFSQMY